MLSILLLITFVIAYGFGIYNEDYPLLWVANFSLLTLLLTTSKPQYRLFWLIVLVYFSIGTLNISSWRGYISVTTINLYIFAFLAMGLPFLVSRREQVSVQGVNSSFLFNSGLLFHLAIVYAALLYVYASHGVVILRNELRFGIPLPLEYIIKSTVPVCAIIPFTASKKYRGILLLVLLLPSIMMSYRGVVLTGLMVYFMSLRYIEHGKITFGKVKNIGKRKGIVLGLVGVLVIVFGFYIRRQAGSELASVDVIISHYFDFNGWYIYVIIPFYLAFRETIGITEQIVSSGITNLFNQYPLFFADLMTVLPGENLGAGKSLALTLGSVDDGGLTPGLLGGLYIDYGLASISVFFLIGLLNVTLFNITRHSFFVAVFITVLMQSIHLLHRGFLKPEYFTSVFIVIFYCGLISLNNKLDSKNA